MNTPGTMTRIGAATHILQGIGAPVNQHTVGSMLGWFNAEGGNWGNTASYNPLNTTLDAPGARPINNAGVKAYNNWDQGLSATINTLRQPNMHGIVQAFHTSNPQAIARAIGTSPWGTNGQLVQQTIGNATGQRYGIPSVRGIAARMSSFHAAGQHGMSVPSVTNTGPSQSTNWGNAIATSLLNDSTGVSENGRVAVHDPLTEAINLVNQGYFTTDKAPTTSLGPALSQLQSTGALGVAMAGKAVQDAGAAGANGDAQKLLGMIRQVAGGAYNQGNHSAALESAGQVRKLGTDCSGFVSWLMGPRGLGIWHTSYATPAIDSAPGMEGGRGRIITVWNNKQPGNAGHVFIQIGNQYFASEGGVGIRQISRAEAAGYIQHGSDGGTYQPLHPRGL